MNKIRRLNVKKHALKYQHSGVRQDKQYKAVVSTILCMNRINLFGDATRRAGESCIYALAMRNTPTRLGGQRDHYGN